MTAGMPAASAQARSVALSPTIACLFHRAAQLFDHPPKRLRLRLALRQGIAADHRAEIARQPERLQHDHGRLERLVGAHAHAAAERRELGQGFGDGGIQRGQLHRVLAVVMREARKQLGRGLLGPDMRQGPLQQDGRAVADPAADVVQAHRRQTDFRKQRVHRAGQVRAAVDQGAVQVEGQDVAFEGRGGASHRFAVFRDFLGFGTAAPPARAAWSWGLGMAFSAGSVQQGRVARDTGPGSVPSNLD